MSYKSDKRAGYLQFWLAGLSKKTAVNIGADKEDYPEFFNKLRIMCRDSSDALHPSFPRLLVTLDIDEDDETKIIQDELLIHLLLTIGHVTLSIRGSNKSFWGKNLEGSLLKTALTILGLEYEKHFEVNVKGDDNGEDWREMDARVYTKEPNAFIPIELGLIGEGNPEITSDKNERIGKYEGVVLVDKVGDAAAVMHNFKGEIITMRGNTDILTRLYDYLNGKCAVELTPPPATIEGIKEKVDKVFSVHPEYFIL